MTNCSKLGLHEVVHALSGRARDTSNRSRFSGVHSFDGGLFENGVPEPKARLEIDRAHAEHVLTIWGGGARS